MHTDSAQSTKSSKLTTYIVVAMIVGIFSGYLIHENASPEFIKDFAPKIKLLATIFLRMVH
jgi:Na+/H+-dicarboxylate symporter